MGRWQPFCRLKLGHFINRHQELSHIVGRPVKRGEKPDTAELETQLSLYPIRMVNETLTAPHVVCACEFCG